MPGPVSTLGMVTISTPEAFSTSIVSGGPAPSSDRISPGETDSTPSGESARM